MNCPGCGSKNLEDARFCIKCGRDLTSQNVCQQCGSVLLEGADFCPSCGQPVKNKGKDNPVKVRNPKKNRGTKIGAMQRLQTKYHLPFNPVWIIVLLAFILLVIGVYFLGFHVPKVCRPLIQTIEGEGYNFGCDDEMCVFWLHGVSTIPDFQLKYQWDGGETGLAECETDPDSPDMLACTFPISSSEGGVMTRAGNADCESTPVIYLDEKRIAELQENSQQKIDESCATFSKDMEAVVQQTQWSYEYDPLNFIIRLDGLAQYDMLTARYEWGNGVENTITCYPELNNNYYCHIPAEESVTDLDIWLGSGNCEEHLQTFDASDIDWQNYKTCSTEYLEAMQSINDTFYYACITEYCFAWVPNISAFPNAVIAYRFDDNQELTYSPDCTWEEEEGVMELSCVILLEQASERITLYVDNDGCLINLGYLDKELIEASQESFLKE